VTDVPTRSEKIKESSDCLDMLDELIEKWHEELKDKAEEQAKLGDFLKMIELRHKLAPGNSGSKQFWKMLEQIRQEALQKDAPKEPSQQKRASKKQAARRVK
jgi:hypothetical protein